MGAQRIYYAAFIVLPGILILAAVWYFRFSAYFHRGSKTKPVAAARATVEVAVVTALLGWLMFA